jgi:hypothetical protein
MIYYMTAAGPAVLEAALRTVYAAALGRALAVDETVPQNDGQVQFHYLFEDDPAAHAVLPRGAHAMISVLAGPHSPLGQIGPQDLAALAAAGVDVKRLDQIDASLLPKFQ